MTRAERLLWSQLRRSDVRFRRQMPVLDYVADFACRKARLIVELDGESHMGERVDRDERREAALCRDGWLVLRITNDQLFEGGYAIAEFIVELARTRMLERGWPLSAMPASDS